MKVVKYILIGILAIVALLLIIGLFVPKETKVERSISINAPKDAVMAQIKSLKNMNNWSPWADYDSEMKVEYEGTDGEVGSTSKWEGDTVGKGSQTITSITEDRVEIDVHFLKPYESKAQAYYNLETEGEGTKVTWGITTHSPYPFNVMSLFMDMDAMIGKDFENGLNKLKVICESGGTSTSYEIHEMDMPAKTYVTKRSVVSFNDIGKYFEDNLPKIMEAMGKNKVAVAGPPSGLYYTWDEKAMKTDMAAAVPAGDAKAKVSSYETVNVPAGKALHLTYYGAYDKMEDAHMAMGKYMADNGVEFNELVIEEYVSDPMSEKDTTKWLTNIYYMVK
jgi:effector-binding domain-containing protein